MSSFPPLECSSILFRVVLYDDWIKNGRIRWQVFKPGKKDIDGVSLFFNRDVPAAVLTEPFFGFLTTHGGRVRDISNGSEALDVIQDQKNHAVIVGIPNPDIDSSPDDDKDEMRWSNQTGQKTLYRAVLKIHHKTEQIYSNAEAGDDKMEELKKIDL